MKPEDIPMEKIIKVLLELLGEQEHAVIHYSIESIEDKSA